MLYSLDGIAPRVGEGAWVAPSADVIGKVIIGARAGIWFGARLRGDNEAITIGDETNIQENCALHTDMGFPLTIGPRCTIGHGAIVHGCTVGEGSLIGMGATVMNGVVLGEHCLVAAGALIPEGKVIPPRSLVIGAPGKVARELDDAAVALLEKSAAHYARNAARFAAGLKPVS